MEDRMRAGHQQGHRTAESETDAVRVLNFITSHTSPCFQKQVSTLEAMGVQCDTLSISDAREQTDESIKRRSVFEYGRFYTSAFKRSFGEYDLLHANYGLTAPPAVLQPNLPVVLSLWGSDLMGQFGEVSKQCAKLADEVIVMNDAMAAKLDCDSHVVPHGIDTERFHPISREDARDEIGWDQDERYVLFPYPPSRKVKDHPRAERVMGAVSERFDGDVTLRTMSDVDHDRVYLYMNAADVLLLTSRREGSPNTVKEALACNLPVVSTDVGDVRTQLDGVSPSAVCDGDRELVDELVDVLDAGERPDSHEKVQREMSIDRMGERILDVYESALED
jgi:glycosyltransferase involved in cell wall biosynthesis